MNRISAAAAAVQTFESRFPSTAKDLCTFFQQLGLPAPDSTTNLNSLLAQLLSDSLISAIYDIERGLRADDMSETSRSDGSNEETKVSAAINPNKLINISQSRTLYTLIELLWLVGLKTTLSMKSRIKDNDIHFPTSLTLQQDLLASFRKCTLQLSLENILAITKAIDFVINHDRFAAFMRDRNLERVVLAYMVMEVEWKEQEEHQEHLQFVQNRLQELFIHSKAYFKTQCVTVLRGMTRGEERIRRRAAEYITQILLSEQGLVAVLQGYLEGLVDSPMCTSMQIQLAKSLASVPTSMTTADYLKSLFQQIVPLWTVALRENDKTLMTTLVFISTRCTQLFPRDIMETLLYRPLLLPLLSIISGERVAVLVDSADPSPAVLVSNNILATRHQVGQALHFLLSFLTYSPPLSFVADMMQYLHIPAIVLRLYMDNGLPSSPPTTMFTTKEESNAAAASVVSPLIQEWSRDILRRLFAMKRENIPLLFESSLFDVEFRHLFRGQFRLYADNSVEIIRLDPTKKQDVLYTNNRSDNDMTSAATFMAEKEHWLRHRSPFAVDLSCWVQLLSAFETYQVETIKPSANRRSNTSANTAAHSAATTTAVLTQKASEEKPVVIKLEGCISQCFVRVLTLYFACLRDDYSGFPTPSTTVIEDASTDAMWRQEQRVRTTLAVQRLLEDMNIEQILIDGDMILQLLHSIIQNMHATDTAPHHSVNHHNKEETQLDTTAPPLPSKKSPLIQEISSAFPSSGSATTPTQPPTPAPASPKSNNEDDNATALDLALTILSSLLLFGPKKRSDHEEARLQSMIPDLMQLATHYQQQQQSQGAEDLLGSDEQTEERSLDIAQRAADLALTIFQRRITTASATTSHHHRHSSSSSSSVPSSSGDLEDRIDRFLSSQTTSSSSSSASVDIHAKYQQAAELLDRIEREELRSLSPAMRAYGLRHVSSLVSALPISLDDCDASRIAPQRDNNNNTQELDVWTRSVISAMRLLRDVDSFVYLNAVLCLQRVFQRSSRSHRTAQHNSSSSSSRSSNMHVTLSALLVGAYAGDVSLVRQVFHSKPTGTGTSSSGAVSETLLQTLDTLLQQPLDVGTGVHSLERWRAMLGEVLVTLLQRGHQQHHHQHHHHHHAPQQTWLASFLPEERELLMGLLAISVRVLRHRLPSLLTAKKAPAAANTLTAADAVVDLFTGRVSAASTSKSPKKKLVTEITDPQHVVASPPAPPEEGEEDQVEVEAIWTQVFASADSVYLLQSAFSIIAELLPHLHVHGHAYLHDLLDICAYVLRPMADALQAYQTDMRALRRAAVFVLRYCAESYVVSSLLREDSLHHIMRIGECVELLLLHDKDEVVVFQAEATAHILQSQIGATIGL